MSRPADDYTDRSDRPTEELYIELRDLVAETKGGDDEAETSQASRPTQHRDASLIRARIDHLRSLLSDRGVPHDD